MILYHFMMLRTMLSKVALWFGAIGGRYGRRNNEGASSLLTKNQSFCEDDEIAPN